MGNCTCSALSLLEQDGYLGLKIGRLNVGDEAPLEARAKAIFNLRKFLGLAGPDAMTICFMLSCRALKVWKKLSSWVRSF